MKLEPRPRSGKAQTPATFGALMVFGFSLLLLASPAECASDPSSNAVQIALSQVKSGEFAFRLTTPEEMKSALGKPEKEHSERDGGRLVLLLEYPGVQAVFTRVGEEGETAPYTLFQLSGDGKVLDIGRGRQMTLRRLEDLGKLSAFFGMAGASLVNLDLRDQLPRLRDVPFDNRTQWPLPEKMPEGFDASKLIEDGKNPGLGLRKLHDQGLDGRNVHIAIIDQPLLRDHMEYKDRVVEYIEIEVQGHEPAVHGAPVTSIAVGKSCGTAPGASVHYYAVPAWKWWNEHCKPYAATLDRIVERNKELPVSQKVRVVSLSLGMMSNWPDHSLWSNAVQKAESTGVLVVTCDPSYYKLTILKRKTGMDADSPTNYMLQFGFASPGALCVPAGNRSTAEHTGNSDYFFWRQGGMSWTVPYLAGLAAVAFQIDSDLKPQTIRELWMKTATATPAGAVVNPPGFIEAVRRAKTAT